jgi:RNA polymerase sigma-70 factor (ECF subfamily)
VLPIFFRCNWYDPESPHSVAFSFVPEFQKKLQPGPDNFCHTPRRTFELNVESLSTTGVAAVPPADPDAADVQRVLAGDVQAFTGIVRRWQGPLVNMAWRYCRDRSRAEEMAQEAFLRAWCGLSQWRQEASFSTWLFALAANVFRSELKRFPTVNVPIEDISEPSALATQYDDFAIKTNNETLRRAVLALPQRYREPVVLFYFHEMDIGAAARTMGLPEGTLKARLSRARSLLKKRFPKLCQLNAISEAVPVSGEKEVQG